jgi:Na+-transporting methylmalonyl-CoA/oxaloacetate decarboxylase gamma subunit
MMRVSLTNEIRSTLRKARLFLGFAIATVVLAFLCLLVIATYFLIQIIRDSSQSQMVSGAQVSVAQSL